MWQACEWADEYTKTVHCYTEHLLRQRPSSPTTTISCPLRLVPFEAAADKGPWLLLVVFIVVYIVLFKEDKLVPGVYVGLIDEADLRAVSERLSGTACCHPSSVVCHPVPHYQFR
ncbi:hypothetical protein JHK87_031012 [Glycine soja]|nr:hypothetical protein JHK87_031012 [Glycine soja]